MCPPGKLTVSSTTLEIQKSCQKLQLYSKTPQCPCAEQRFPAAPPTATGKECPHRVNSWSGLLLHFLSPSSGGIPPLGPHSIVIHRLADLSRNPSILTPNTHLGSFFFQMCKTKDDFLVKRILGNMQQAGDFCFFWQPWTSISYGC